MFARLGNLVVSLRYAVIAVMVGFLGILALLGLGVEKNLSQSGWEDPGSESVAAAHLGDGTYGRDTNGDVIAMYTAPDGKTVNDPEFSNTVVTAVNKLAAEHKDKIAKINFSYWKTDQTPAQPILARGNVAVVGFAIAGANDTELTKNFREIRPEFKIDGVDVKLAGLQAVAGTLNDTMAQDVRRMELLAIPAVGILLFFVFGGIVAAALPLIVGGLTVAAAMGCVNLLTHVTQVNAFVSPVVSMVGLGLAIDYALFIISRFREGLAEGYDPRTAVRRSVQTAGRTVVFSATIIVASLGGLLLFPQAFLKSVAYGAIATVSIAAFTSITVLPAILAILGPRIDAFGFKWLRKTKTVDEIEGSIWGRLTRWVMQNPLKVTIPIVVGLLLLIIPVGSLTLGGISERYLPPNNETRLAQKQFDETFQFQRTEPIKLLVTGIKSTDIRGIISQADQAPGLVKSSNGTTKFSLVGGQTGTKDGVWVLQAGLADRSVVGPTIDYLRSEVAVPEGAEMLVGGTPAIEYDSIQGMFERMPLTIVVIVLTTTLLMFLTFGSLVLPIKAALMSVLSLGSTLGILTWMFVAGHAAGLLNFTPGPIMSPVLALIIAIVYGLSTDYEIFLLARMVEARTTGASTSEAIRVGSANTGRIITAAALILIVVTGAFGFSELVMMQYIAYGMIAALIIDATLIRMFLVPATMKLLGDDCWWAPAWMQAIQRKLGLAEPILGDDRIPTDVPQVAYPVSKTAAQRQSSTPTFLPTAAFAATSNRAEPERIIPGSDESAAEQTTVLAPVTDLRSRFRDAEARLKAEEGDRRRSLSIVPPVEDFPEPAFDLSYPEGVQHPDMGAVVVEPEPEPAPEPHPAPEPEPDAEPQPRRGRHADQGDQALSVLDLLRRESGEMDPNS